MGSDAGSRKTPRRRGGERQETQLICAVCKRPIQGKTDHVRCCTCGASLHADCVKEHECPGEAKSTQLLEKR